MIRSRIGRHRGLILAGVLVLVGLVSANRAIRPRPISSWTQETAEVVQFSPDARRLLMLGGKRAWLRDVESGTTTNLTLGSSGGTVGTARFLDGGRTAVVFWNAYGSVRAWDVGSGGMLWDHVAPGDQPGWFAAYSPDGSTLAFATPRDRVRSTPATITAWNRSWGGPRTYPGTPTFALSGNGRYLAVAEGGLSRPTILVREAATGRRVGVIPVKPETDGRAVAVSGDGTTLVEITPDETVVWDVATASRKATVDVGDGHQNTSHRRCVELFGEDRFLFALESGHEDWLKAWDLAASPPRRIFEGQVDAVSPDGRRVVRRPPSPARFVARPELVELPSGRVVPGAFGEDASGMQFSRDGGVLAMTIRESTSSDNHPLFSWIPLPFRPRWFDRNTIEFRVLDATSGRRLASVVIGNDPDRWYDSWLTPDGKNLLVRSYFRAKEGPTLAKFDLWDVRPRPTIWPIEAGLSGLAVACGIWWDSRRRRRRTGVPA